MIESAHAIADVKYKRLGSRWIRSDLYEVTTFALAAAARRAAIIGFAAAEDPLPPAVGVGDIAVRSFGWIADPKTTPGEAAEVLANEVGLWLAA